MLDNTHNQDNVIGRHLAEGPPVYDVNGAKVGTISEQGVQGDNLVLQKGLIFPHDYYVPLRTVSHSDADGIYLNVTKDDVTNQTFDNATATNALGATSGYDDTAISSQASDRDMRVPVLEEQLNIGKQQTEAGRARIQKDVVEEQQTTDVPVTHEELRVEHVPVQGGDRDIGPDAFTERDIDVPLRGEQVVVNKEARVTEEVQLHKQQVTENQQVSDTVRKERVRIEGEGINQGQGDVPLGRDPLAYDESVDDAQPRRGV